MSQYVKVSTINFSTCHALECPENTNIVDFVISDLEKNINQVLVDKPDLIILPEVCDRPVGINIQQRQEYYALRKDKVLNYLKKKAKENNCYITYPAVIEVDGIVRNACQMIDRKGEVIGVYSKNYPVMGEHTDHGIRGGKEPVIFECDFGRVACIICFDLNFPELRSKIKELNPDMIIFPSHFQGGFLKNYFAFDTRSYFVSSLGHANMKGQIISPVGETIAESTLYYNYLTATLNLDYQVVHLDYNTQKLRDVYNKYADKVSIHDSGDDLGVVLISSETKEFTAKDVLKEFDIPTVDEYFEKSRQVRNQYIM